MAYNKAKAEREWRLWKEAEEKQMRRLGVDEETVAKIREYDWAVFNSNRRFYQRVQSTDTYYMDMIEDCPTPEIKTVEQLLDSIENEGLYRILNSLDKLTLQALLLNLQGYSVPHISALICMNEETLYKRLQRLKEKIKQTIK